MRVFKHVVMFVQKCKIYQHSKASFHTVNDPTGYYGQVRGILFFIGYENTSG